MTDRKAIKMLKGFLLITSIAEIEDEEEKEEIGETFQTAISALEERQERKKGCEYCTGELKTACNDCGESPCSLEKTMRCERRIKRALQSEIRENYIFCPWCGKPLKGNERWNG